MCHFFVLRHFDVICDLLLNRRRATWNLFVTQLFSYIFIEKKKKKTGKKKEKRKYAFGRTRALYLRLVATIPNHHTTEANYITHRKSLSFYSFSMKLPPARWSPAALTELLTVKKQCKRIFHGNEWMKEHNYALENADTSPRLQSICRTQNICFVISISTVI